MLGNFLAYLHAALIPVLLIGIGIVILLTIFKKAEYGLLALVILIPQPNIWFKLHMYPMGSYLLNFLFLAVCLGMIFQGRSFAKTKNVWLIALFIVVSYISLWNSSMYFSLPWPFTTSNPLFKPWKNYAMMIAMYFLALNAAGDEDRQKRVVTVMSLVILFISIRGFRAYTAGEMFLSDSRYAGPFWIVGLGANHMGAFIAHYGAVILGLALFVKNIWQKGLFLTTTLFALHPLFFSYSRGAYAAALGTAAAMGIMKKKSLLLLVIAVVVCWHTILPASVVDRIGMTETDDGELEYSAAVRLDLWNKAISYFVEKPVFGIGFDGFAVAMVLRGERYADTHNFFLKTLCEQGIVGSLLLVLIILAALRSGWALLQAGRTPFHKGLGFGFLGCVIAVIITNMFGDRWSYIELGSYFWVFWGLVDRGVLISRARDVADESNKEY
jgi:O-antigen ligase